MLFSREPQCSGIYIAPLIACTEVYRGCTSHCSTPLHCQAVSVGSGQSGQRQRKKQGLLFHANSVMRSSIDRQAPLSTLVCRSAGAYNGKACPTAAWRQGCSVKNVSAKPALGGLFCPPPRSIPALALPLS